ncbi:MAG: signal peptide peptidase SppA [Rhodospirillales bacterium]|nr:signal peptide peptidase SppA [Rhodospirillales bacterium]
MRRLLVGFLAIVGLLVLFAAAAAVGLFLWLAPEEPEVPPRTILALDLTQSLAERAAADPLEELVFEPAPSLRDVVDALQRAASDPRVVGVFALLGDDVYGFATTQELRAAIKAFRASRKPAIAFADSFGEFGSGLRSYYLATAFDEIWLQPGGSVGLVGLRSENPFLRDVLEKIGVEPRFERREEYKTVFNNFIESGFTKAHKEELERLLGTLYRQVARDVAASRGLAPEAAERLLGGGPWLASEAERERLVDHVGWRDEALDRLRGGGAKVLSVLDYLERAGRPNRKGTRIALVHGSGPIQRGDPAGGLLSGDRIMSADEVAQAFRQAVADPKVKAIIFRVDSPGGSAVASETIWRETIRAQKAGKPVIVSMGDYAGSGGYYVAAGASKIVAQPGTLTGSIGVIAGKVVTRAMWEKLGIAWDWVGYGENAGMFSLIEDFTPEQRQRFEAGLDNVYEIFKTRVAAGRRMTSEEVEAVAKGRVWTGEEAMAKGLVDALGGYGTALALAREAAGLAPDAPVELVSFPPERGPLDLVWALLTGEKHERRPEAGTAALVRLLRPLVRLVEEPPGPLTMPLGELR